MELAAVLRFLIGQRPRVADLIQRARITRWWFAPSRRDLALTPIGVEVVIVFTELHAHLHVQRLLQGSARHSGRLQFR